MLEAFPVLRASGAQNAAQEGVYDVVRAVATWDGWLPCASARTRVDFCRCPKKGPREKTELESIRTGISLFNLSGPPWHTLCAPPLQCVCVRACASACVCACVSVCACVCVCVRVCGSLSLSA